VTDTLKALEDAARIARACSHSKRLDLATASAIRALVDFAEASLAHAKASANRPVRRQDDHPDFASVNAAFDP
jgi:hypothetical protein